MRFNWRRAPVVAAFFVCSALGATTTLAAQAIAESFTPSVGQQGKDVIWVPTPQSLVERMLQMAATKPTDYVVDLGSGDGRTVITAVKKFGARALGIEYNAEMVELSKRNAEKEGVTGKAQFMQADIFATDFSKATVLTMYLLPSLNVKLRPTILNMKPGTRVVSHAFMMEEWQPDQTEASEGRNAYMWIVPAKVEGTWRIELTSGSPRAYDAKFEQQFQNLQGSIKSDNKALVVRSGKLRGEAITFSLIEDGKTAREFTGVVAGDRMEGTTKLGGSTAEAKWTAVRQTGAR